MLEALAGIFSSSGLGAIVGLAGSWLTKRENRKMAALQFSHDETMANIEMQMQSAEFDHAIAVADKNIQQAQVEGDIQKDIAETTAFTESLKVQRTKSGVKIIDGIRFLMRPIITVYLLLVVSYVTYKIHALIGGFESLPATELFDLYRHIIYQSVFLVVTAVTWWFGSRGSKSIRTP